MSRSLSPGGRVVDDPSAWRSCAPSASPPRLWMTTGVPRSHFPRYFCRVNWRALFAPLKHSRMRLTTGSDGLVVPIRPSPAWASALVVGALLLVFALDRQRERHRSASVLLPIILAGHRFRMRWGVHRGPGGDPPVPRGESSSSHIQVPENGSRPDRPVSRGGRDDGEADTMTRNRLHQLAMTDDLTGLHNLRSFEGRWRRWCAQSRETRAPLALLVRRRGPPEVAERPIRTSDRCRSRAHGRPHHRPDDSRLARSRAATAAMSSRWRFRSATSFRGHRVATDLCEAVHNNAQMLAGRAFAAGTLSISVGGTCSSFDGRASARGVCVPRCRGGRVVVPRSRCRALSGERERSQSSLDRAVNRRRCQPENCSGDLS